jgi:hypothetical protein
MVVVVVGAAAAGAGAGAVVIIHLISLQLLATHLYVYCCTNKGGHEISLSKINVNLLCQAQPIFGDAD